MAVTRLTVVSITIMAALHGVPLLMAGQALEGGCRGGGPPDHGRLVEGLMLAPRTGGMSARHDVLLEVSPREELAALLHQLQPWQIISAPGGKRSSDDQPNYSPRLGRESSEEQQEEDESSSAMEARVPPFAPRLGRRREEYIPRLGRALLSPPRQRLLLPTSAP